MNCQCGRAFSLAQLCCRAPADVRDKLIRRLMETQSSHEAGQIVTEKSKRSIPL